VLQDPKHTGGPSTSNRHEGQAEYLVQAGYVSGGITINTVNSPRRRWPWGLFGVAGVIFLIAYLLLSGTYPPLTGRSPAGPVQLRSIESDLCAAVPTNEGVVKQSPCNDAPSSGQFWRMEGPANSTLLSRTRDRDTKICLELRDRGSQPHGAPVQVAHCNDSRADNQLWRVEAGETSDTVRIRNVASNGRCLSPATEPPEPQLVIKDCSGGRGSQWKIIPRDSAK
jgi:hypothetical protein